MRTFRLLRWACFALLGGLTGLHVAGERSAAVFFFALGLFLLLLLGLALLRWLLGLFNPQVRSEHGGRAIGYAIARGYLVVVPFAVLAAFAELYLHWNATQAFTAAGLMMAGTAVGAEMVKLGGNRVASLALPALSSFLISTVWMIFSRWGG